MFKSYRRHGSNEANSYSETDAIVDKTEGEEMDHLIDEEDEDTAFAFCIIPSSQQKMGRRRSNQKSRKREREESPTTRKTSPISKRNKSESPPPQTTRSSPRGKESIITTPKTLVGSQEGIDSPAKKLYLSESDDEDTKLGDDDKDYVPKTENVPIKPKRVKLKKCIPCLEPSCTVKFSSMKAMFPHLKTAHKDLVPYQCKICKQKCGHRRGIFAAHMVMRHEDGEKKLSCVKCGKKFCLEENLARHLKLHEVEGVKPLVCDVCDDRFENEEKLQRHVETHGPKYQCRRCARKFHYKQGLQRHERSHTGERPEKCSLCDASFARKITLQRHILRDHSATSTKHICHICGKGYHLQCDLKAHLDRHEGRHQVKCDTCGEIFSDPNTLQAHRVKMHGDDPVICDECGRSFTSTGTLQEHKRIHTGVKKHKCETCGARFRRPYALAQHIRTHTGERPYPCPHCEKAFKTRADMLKHVKVIHTQATPTPHKCPHCDKACRIPFQRRHIRQAHTGVRPFTCDQCAKGFAVKSALTLHLKTSHGVVPEKIDRLPRSKKDAFRVEDDND